MLTWSGLNPVFLEIGPFNINWYGLMYMLGFICARLLVRNQLRDAGMWGTAIDAQTYDKLIFWLVIGVVIGGRLAYVIFYWPWLYLRHPMLILEPWHGGMSFHGGMAGPLLAGWLFCRRHRLPFLRLSDMFFTAAPLGLAFGRIGNFINGELWGRVTTMPWGIIYPKAGPLPRHPSELYEMTLEGFVLFAVMWSTRNKDWPDGCRTAIFLIGYALARSFCEMFRQPDPQLGFLFGPITMGMLLSSVMLVVGLIMFWRLRRRGKEPALLSENVSA